MPGVPPDAPFALARRFPEAAARLPRLVLTTLPTPVAPLPALGRVAGGGELWIKRDDVSGVVYGGNKPRKLELLLAEARARGRHWVLTAGGLGTHHGLATAACARGAGLRTTLILLPQPVTDHVRHCLLVDHALGAELHLARGTAGVVGQALRLVARGWLRGDPPYVIPVGGTSALGTIGYLNAGLELAEQVAAGELEAPDFVFVPLGSGGTVAGLAAGFALAGLETRVVGVLVTDILPPSHARLTRLARAALRRLGLDAGTPDVGRRIRIDRDFVGAGYGAPTTAGEEALALAHDLERVTLEPTYTAKCLAALLQRAGEAPYRGRRLLFWNTFSAVDPGATLALPAPRDLPRAFHRFFA